MFMPLKTLLVAGGLALGLATSAMTPAQAANTSFTFGNGNLSLSFGDAPQQVHHRGYRRHGQRARFCTPRRALRKAERRGLRRAHIRRVNGRRIVVAGRMRGERVVIGMGRHRSCPVDFVRVKDGYNDRRRHYDDRRRSRVERLQAPIVVERPRDRKRTERTLVRDEQALAERKRALRRIERQNRRRENR